MAQTYTDAWHTQEAADERAWLDQWTRSERTPQCPWARPDWDVTADWATALAAQTATAGRR